MKCFKTSGNRQRKAVISERGNKKVCSVTSQEYCMYSFHDAMLGRENQSLLEKPKLRRQIWLFRETKADKVPRAKYQRRESRIKRVWSSAEEPLKSSSEYWSACVCRKTRSARNRTTRKKQVGQLTKFTEICKSSQPV